jgi:nucleoside-diphosphate kinase
VPHVAVQRTLVLLKPDAVQRGLAGTILGRFEAKGLKLVALKMRRFDKAVFERHYEPHKGKPFYPGLLEYMSSSPVVALALEGVDAIEVVRNLMGATNSRKAAPGTIRGDLGMSFSNNLVHGSDSTESAERELAIFFGQPGELCEWTPTLLPWLYNAAEELE